MADVTQEELDLAAQRMRNPGGPSLAPLPEDPNHPAYSLIRNSGGRAAWGDERIPLQDRTQDFLHFHATQGTTDWRQISGQAQQHFPGVDLTPAARPYEQMLNTEQARQRYRDWVPTTWDIAGREMIPFVSTVFSQAERNWATDAERRVSAGRAHPADYDILARSQRLNQLYEGAGFPAQVARTIAGLPAVAGEIAFAGGMAQSGSSLLGARVASTVSGPTSLAGRGAAFAGRTAVTTAVAPSMWLPGATENAAANGGTWDQLRNLGPAYATGFVNTAVIGSVQNYGGRGALGLFSKAAIGVGEQAVADVATGFMNQRLGLKNAHYGLLPDLLEGKLDDVAKHGFLQLLTFSLLGAMHHEWGPHNPVTEAADKVLAENKRQGLSAEASGTMLSRAWSRVTESLKAGPEATVGNAADSARERATEYARVNAVASAMAPGPERTLVEVAAKAMPKKVAAKVESTVLAPAEQSAARTDSPITPEQATAALAKQPKARNVVAKPEGLDADSRAFIERRVKLVGSLEKAQEAYPGSDAVGKYAREFARQHYGRPGTAQEAPPGPPAAPEAARPPEAAQTPPVAKRTQLTAEEKAAKIEAMKTSKWGTGTRLAFGDLNPGEVVAVTDVDKLGSVSKEKGKEAGDALIRAKVEALRRAGLEPFHAGQDEFLVRGTDPKDLADRLEQARRFMKEAGGDFSYGVGDSMAKADDAMRAAKEAKKAGGTEPAARAPAAAHPLHEPLVPPVVQRTRLGRVEYSADGGKTWTVSRATALLNAPAPKPESPPAQPIDKRSKLQSVMAEAGLSGKEAHVLIERGVNRRKLEEIASDPIVGGVSRERVRQIEAEALKKLGKDTSLWKTLIEPGKQEAFLEAVERGQETHTHFDVETGRWVEERVSARDLVSMAELSGQYDQETGKQLAKAARRRLSAVDQASLDLERLSDRMDAEAGKGPLSPGREAYYVGEIERLTRISQGKFEGAGEEPQATTERPVEQPEAALRRRGRRVRPPEQSAGADVVRPEVADAGAGQAAQGPAEAPGAGQGNVPADAAAAAGRGEAGGDVIARGRLESLRLRLRVAAEEMTMREYDKFKRETYPELERLDALVSRGGVSFLDEVKAPSPYLPEESRPGLRPGELEVVKAYTDSKQLANDVNAYLRDTTQGAPDRVKAVAERLHELFARLPDFPEPVVVYRKLRDRSDTRALLDALRRGLESGDVVTMEGFVSTTTDADSQPVRGEKIVLRIKASKGLDLKPHSAYPQEWELLLDSHQPYRVAGYSEEGGRVRVDLEQINETREVPVRPAGVDQGRQYQETKPTPGVSLPQAPEVGPQTPEAARAAARLERQRRRQGLAQQPTPGGTFPAAPTAEQQRAGSIGGGQPEAGELSQQPLRETALANAQVNLERAARDLDSLMAEGVVPNQQARDAAFARLTADPEAGAKLVDDLATNMRPADVVELALLLQRRMALHNELDVVTLSSNAESANRTKARGDPKLRAEVEAKLDALDAQHRALEAQLDEVDRVTSQTGTETARSLQFRQRMMAADYSLAGILDRAERAIGERLAPDDPRRQQIADLAARIKELQDQLAGMEPGRAYDDTRYKLHKVRAQADAHVEAWKRANAPLYVKAGRVLGELTSSLPRSVMASIDFVLGRQGLLPLITHPVQTGKAIPEMFKAFLSEEAALRASYDIDNRPLAALGKKAGLDLGGGGTTDYHAQGYLTDLAHRIPALGWLLKASERSAQTFLKRIRSSIFDSQVSLLAQGGKVTLSEAKVLANAVNVFSGRGPLGFAEPAGNLLAHLFFAPKWTVSRFQTLLGQPLYSSFSESARRARKLVAWEYAKMVGAFSTVGFLAALNGWMDPDPRSSSFGKIRVGNTRLDFTGGLAGVARFLSQTATLTTKDQHGQYKPLWRPSYGQDNWADVALHFARGKLAPAPATVFSVLSGEDVVGQPVTPASAGLNLMTPLFVNDVFEAVEDLGMGKGLAVSLLGLMGVSETTYGGNQTPRAEQTPGGMLPRLERLLGLKPTTRGRPSQRPPREPSVQR